MLSLTIIKSSAINQDRVESEAYKDNMKENVNRLEAENRWCYDLHFRKHALKFPERERACETQKKKL